MAGSNALCQWKLGGQGNLRSLLLERSTDGRGFQPLATIGTLVTSYIDATASGLQASKLYYRLRLQEADGAYGYSPIALLQKGTAASYLQVYPIPVSAGSHASVSYSLQNGTGSIAVYDLLGRQLQLVPVSGMGSVQLPTANLPSGTYLLQLRSSSGRPLASSKLVVAR